MKRLFAVCAVALLATACSNGEAESTPAVEVQDDRARLIDIANALDVAVDAKDWGAARSYFADDVTVDFTSLAGGEPATIPADDLIGGWRANLFAEKTSFHLRGNHVVAIDGDGASMVSHGYAWNKYDALADDGGALWEVWGVYEYDFARLGGDWKITAFTFTATHQRGNAAVPGAARE